VVKIEGSHGIYAAVLKDSISPQGVRLLSFEVQYPRLVLAELNTHGMLSKNSASSRAIPFAKMQEQLLGRPVRFGQANPGMQDKGEDYREFVNGYTPEEWWRLAKLSAQKFSEGFYEAGFHKQCYNRLTEPFQMMKTVISGTEWNNFLWLRDHEAADPALAELARCIREATYSSVPTLLSPGEYHLPYVDTFRDEDDGTLLYGDLEEVKDHVFSFKEFDLETAKKVSSARSAAVSFRNVDYGVQKCLEVYDRLVGDDRKHGSAMEHQATPLKPIDYFHNYEVNTPFDPATWEDGVSHVDRDGKLWSGKFKGWVQFRKLIPGENIPG